MFNIFQAWSWVVKAINELHENSTDILKLRVISHAIKVCSEFNKLKTAKKLIDQLRLYNREIDQNIHVDLLLNETYYSLKTNLAINSNFSHYVRIIYSLQLIGYSFLFNLHLILIF